MIRRPPRSTLSSSSAASDVYKRQYQRRVRETMMELHVRMLDGQVTTAEVDGTMSELVRRVRPWDNRRNCRAVLGWDHWRVNGHYGVKELSLLHRAKEGSLGNSFCQRRVSGDELVSQIRLQDQLMAELEEQHRQRVLATVMASERARAQAAKVAHFARVHA
eukprot:TRINITY_DN31018_c0_g1_i1.p1 TRINITY_DN31018_c0_g1~~TRINITY_DN31018_c0_g1_i1.p1  ORF type:complete len:162 (-),score=35.14 TRINITY_DN31018_c0_g1_i1:336-821(-)